MSTLDRAILIAAQAHLGQKDRAGKPYILHPLRQMMRFSTEPEQIVAVLHDVVEDSDLTLADLRDAGFSEEIITAVDHLTRREQESYEAFVERTLQHPLARRIKLTDLEDNMNLTRLPSFTHADAERMARYHTAWLKLNHHITLENQEKGKP
ncbi:MAG: GTP pyrophosphokinase [Gemmatimonadetes bacterium]|nr:MAG: GTP pyrophosphokinase [Gemmatimonadota bacterium]